MNSEESYWEQTTVDDMEGHTIKYVSGVEFITQNDMELKPNMEEVYFVMEDGTVFGFGHKQQCCENVCLLDVEPSSSEELRGAKIIESIVSSSSEEDPLVWTFYKIKTSKGYVTMRWGGPLSYYGMEVDVIKFKKKHLNGKESMPTPPYFGFLSPHL